ncbi:ABC transporter ATP-binding protein [Periweissella cryptocerci]|uniref:Multidrug resistance ABC transporter ATP-binding and permease protein n=2 Tax=Periweissella cryptocerci TaxID=2506420 RepID=A0A4P6YXC2_9LACO|nr:ABC transporter ATP-binding protein [Periweissella cryptocerci]QBO37491.1 ABC transporter ATP-binding protein [Periweissella cryptocerci]
MHGGTRRPKGKNKFNWKNFFNLIKVAHPQWRYLGTGLVLGLFGVIGNLATPTFASKIISTFKNGLNKELIAIALILFIGAAIVSSVGNFLLGVAGEQIVQNLRKTVWDKLVVLKVKYFDEVKSGEMISRLVNDTSQVKTLVANSFPNFITGLIQLIGAIVLMFVADWHMTLMMLIAIPLAAAAMAFPMIWGGRIGRATQDGIAEFSGQSTDTLAEIRLVKASGSEKQELERGHNQINHLFKLGRREAIIDGVSQPLMSMVMMGVFILIIAFGAYRVSEGVMTTAALIAFMMYLFQMMPPVMTIATFATTLAKTQGATERIGEILKEDAEDLNAGTSVNVAGKTLAVEHVDFGYNKQELILQDVSFEAKPNTIVAFAGPSGGGKSTIFGLLERFYEPTSGAIKIGDKNVANTSLESWRDQIGFVSQDSSIMAGTIRDNLTYGLDGSYTDDQLWHVLELAYAKNFVAEMQDGLDTQVGERGVKVSGGQRQRLAIARAFLRDPKILMLDEATASLDSESEAMVQKALESLMKDRTTLVIAHRLSTIVDADNIYFIEHGKVTGSGTHKELVASHELYKEYVNEQVLTA